MNLFHKYFSYKRIFLAHFNIFSNLCHHREHSPPDHQADRHEYPYDEVDLYEKHQASPDAKPSDTQDIVIQELDPYIEDLAKKMNTPE
jgi:hypothetical protein